MNFYFKPAPNTNLLDSILQESAILLINQNKAITQKSIQNFLSQPQHSQ